MRTAAGYSTVPVALSLTAVRRRSTRAPQIVGGVHEGNVREGLRVVADETVRLRIVLFGEQADVIAQCEQCCKQAAGVASASQQREVVGQPEVAQQERRFAGGQAVNCAGRGVPGDKAVGDQALLYGRYGAAHSRIVGRKESHQRQHQQTGVEFRRSIGLHEGSQLGVEPLTADFVVDGCPQLPPVFVPAVEAELPRYAAVLGDATDAT